MREAVPWEFPYCSLWSQGKCGLLGGALKPTLRSEASGKAAVADGFDFYWLCSKAGGFVCGCWVWFRSVCREEMVLTDKSLRLVVLVWLFLKGDPMPVSNSKWSP